ncbi:WecB/TagA/CpsF family glycosyltransferase [Mucilaginibacter auburnensis]|uniref:N-acetylglucosaminyldiphosphoundecaprenol N-acetyl-beta-D-mannosaminyltransferase n=1 Tax=Mucilaginibacter auburnensis TaxID=1457233 RepID=A0A2H9VTB6_9SPHI|nr:WecB/TagA/CpsF family glycosyltransferase [Mucilaginibacter auburnensis]PJJ84058.1 N-acetylglucosaminyldiphosphoundecaprenol N-acetyl-beta-D-mannosaminyltransferase [Mucilaginibacter auburnensis]
MQKRRLISLDISIGPYKEFLTEILTLAKAPKASYVCVANVHMLVEAYNDPTFADKVNSAAIVTPDGMPLAKGIKSIYKINQDRVAGMDLLPDLLREANDEKLSVLFYGGSEDVVEKLKEYAAERHSDIKLTVICPPFRPLSPKENEQIISEINSVSADILFISLGCPKQENWMAQMHTKINRGVMVGIGGALPVMLGMQKRAPKWMQDASLEWLYRLIQEPKRLYKRYAITNATFMRLMFLEHLRILFKR